MTVEEQKWIEFLGEKYQISKQQWEMYPHQGKELLKKLRLELLRELQKDTRSFEALDNVCRVALKDLKEKTIQARIAQFLAATPLKVMLGQRFIENFSALINSLRIFGDAVRTEIESKWNEILASYEQGAVGFSKLLAHYSYLDPTKGVDMFVDGYQKKFLEKNRFERDESVKKSRTFPIFGQKSTRGIGVSKRA